MLHCICDAPFPYLLVLQSLSKCKYVSLFPCVFKFRCIVLSWPLYRRRFKIQSKKTAREDKDSEKDEERRGGDENTKAAGAVLFKCLNNGC